MAKGYWIAHVDVTDAEGYKDYQAANAIAFRKFGARFLVRGGGGAARATSTSSLWRATTARSPEASSAISNRD